MTRMQRKHLEFLKVFLGRFINQGVYEDRSIETSLNLAWELLSEFDTTELTKIDDKELFKKYHHYVSPSEVLF